MLRPIRAWAAGVLCLMALSAAPAADKAKSAEDVLAEKGVRTLGSYLAADEESDFSKMFRDAGKLKRELTLAQRDLHFAEAAEAQVKKTIVAYTQKRQLLRRQLDNVPTTIQYNRIVGAMNELGDRITQLMEADPSKQTKAVRDKANQAREAYVQHLLEMEKLAEQIRQKYVKLAADPDAKAAVEALNQETGESYELVESRGFQSNLKNLQKLQDQVISESIPLRDDGSDTFWVTTVFNGKHTQDLVLDSGASLISLPAKMAEAMGLQPGSDAPVILLSLADGSMIEGRQITIPEVRVGKFHVEDVEAVVIPAEYANAPALLGMSFLKNFDFKIDSASKTLTMTKVETDDGPSRPTRGRRPQKPGF